MIFYYQIFKSPVGPLHAIADDKNLWVLAYDANIEILKKNFANLIEKDNGVLKKTRLQLKEYFAGDRETFDIPFSLKGTVFQQQTWMALLSIPYGKTVSYQEQAIQLNKPLAVRAVGRTNGLNPVSIILPCHRVISKSGQLTGYAGGLKAKEFLLNLESRYTVS